jgi:hypothetical protein
MAKRLRKEERNGGKGRGERPQRSEIDVKEEVDEVPKRQFLTALRFCCLIKMARSVGLRQM